MGAARCLSTGTVLGIYDAPKGDTAVVTIADEGVFIYNLNNGATVCSWPLGLDTAWELTLPARFMDKSSHLACVIKERLNGESKLLIWSTLPSSHSLGIPSTRGGTILQLATQIRLPTTAREVVPAGTAREGGPMAYVALSDGSVVLCSEEGVIACEDTAKGMPMIAASAVDGRLWTVHAVRGASSVLVGRFSTAGNALTCEVLQQIDREEKNVFAVAAAITAGRVFIMWSDGQIASYDTRLSSRVMPRGTLKASLTRQLTGFNLSNEMDGEIKVVSSKISTGKTPNKSARSRKRSSRSVDAGDNLPQAEMRCAAVSALGTDGIVAVVGWSVEDPELLKIVCLDVVHGSVQFMEELRPQDAGVDRFGSRAVQAPSRCSERIGLDASRTLLFAAGGTALVMEIPVERPTLASLIGSLALDATRDLSNMDKNVKTKSISCSKFAKMAFGEDGSMLHSRSGPGVPPCRLPSNGSGSVVISDALDPLTRDMGAKTDRRGKPSTSTMRKGDDTAGEDLLQPAKVTWGDGTDSGDVDVLVRKKIHGATCAKRGITAVSFDAAVKPLLSALAQDQRKTQLLSYQTLCSVLVAAAEVKNWDVLEKVLAFQKPLSLSGCPGLVPNLAAAGQVYSFHFLLKGTGDLASEDISRTLEVLLLSYHRHETRATTSAEDALAAELQRNAEAALTEAEDAISKQEDALKVDKLLLRAAHTAACVQGFKTHHMVLHSLLLARHDSSTLTTALQTISSRCALLLLRYLLQWIRNHRTILLGDSAGTLTNETAVDDANLCRVVPLQAVLEWTVAVFDACFSRLALHGDAVKVLEQVYREIVPWTASLKRLSRVRGAVDHILATAPLATSSTDVSGRYFLEWLSLKAK